MKETATIERHTESGSVLIWIFVVIALFAALSYAVSRSNQSGGVQMVSDQQATVLASDILNFTTQIENAVSRLLMQGCSETEISISNNVHNILTDQDGNPAANLTHLNTNAPDDFRCHIFHPRGGGVTPRSTPKRAVTNNGHDITYGKLNLNLHPENFVFAGIHRIEGVGTDSRPELILVLALLRPEVCVKINDMVGVNNPNGHPPEIDSLPSAFTGNYINTSMYEGEFKNKTTFCADTPEHAGTLMKVLIPR